MTPEHPGTTKSSRLPFWALAVIPIVLFAAASAIFIWLAPIERLAGELGERWLDARQSRDG